MKYRKGILAIAAVILLGLSCPNKVTAQEAQETNCDEFAFWADSYEEALKVAENQKGELLSYSYGVGVVQISREMDAEITPFSMQEKTKKEDQTILYEQNWYTTDDTSSTSDAQASDKQWYLNALSAKTAWKSSKGKDVTIAVIDSGVDQSHEDLQNCLKETITVIPEDQYPKVFQGLTPGPQDNYGHGTHVIGIIGATENGIGITGLAPEAKIISIKALDYKNGTGQGKTSWVVSGVEAAIERKVDIINMSIGGSNKIDSMLQEVIQKANRAGIIVVCAAGNTAVSTVFYPAAYPETIAVAALRQTEKGMIRDSDYSNYGSFVDISAPGTEIYSTDIGGYRIRKGTSMACPMVSSSIALLKSKNPKLKTTEITSLLYESCVDLGDPGRDDYYGHGALNLGRMMKLYLEKYENASKPEETEAPEEEATQEEQTNEEQTNKGQATENGGSNQISVPVEQQEEDMLYTMSEPSEEKKQAKETTVLEECMETEETKESEETIETESLDMEAFSETTEMSETVEAEMKENEDDTEDTHTEVVTKKWSWFTLLWIVVGIGVVGIGLYIFRTRQNKQKD